MAGFEAVAHFQDVSTKNILGIPPTPTLQISESTYDLQVMLFPFLEHGAIYRAPVAVGE